MSKNNKTTAKQQTNSKNLVTTNYNLPYNPKLISKARELRKNMTGAEIKLWASFFRQQNFRVFRQRPIDQYIVDFYIPKYKLVIEIDGDTHYERKVIIYDEQRTKILQKYNLRVIRFTNEDVLNNFDSVCESIQNYLI